jgi:hypothetical protein
VPAAPRWGREYSRERPFCASLSGWRARSLARRRPVGDGRARQAEREPPRSPSQSRSHAVDATLASPVFMRDPALTPNGGSWGSGTKLGIRKPSESAAALGGPNPPRRRAEWPGYSRGRSLSLSLSVEPSPGEFAPDALLEFGTGLGFALLVRLQRGGGLSK